MMTITQTTLIERATLTDAEYPELEPPDQDTGCGCQGTSGTYILACRLHDIDAVAEKVAAAARAKALYAVVDSLREEGDTWIQPSKDAIHTVANTLERELEAAGLERPNAP